MKVEIPGPKIYLRLNRAQLFHCQGLPVSFIFDKALLPRKQTNQTTTKLKNFVCLLNRSQKIVVVYKMLFEIDSYISGI